MKYPVLLVSLLALCASGLAYERVVVCEEAYQET